MRVVIATHGHCFDGLASAVIFERLHRHVAGPGAEYSRRGCGYGASQQRADEALLVGDENAILDYRFTPSERLGWYFDHHRTAFADDAARAAFEAAQSTRRYYYDADYGSCTRLVADVAARDFGLVAPELAELVRWADVIDTARFTSAEAATDRSEPVMQLVGVTEQYGDDRWLAELVPLLLERPLAEVAASALVRERWAPLAEKHDRFVERVRDKARRAGRVVAVDLTDQLLETVGKFVTYALFPDSLYSVVLGRTPSGLKLAVGFNPWNGASLDADISEICARHGGGGHPYVGGISFRVKELERARDVMREIVTELSG
jgi:hypothetical protein